MSKRKILKVEQQIPVFEFIVGERLFAYVPGINKPKRIVIVEIIDSIYDGEKIIVFRYFGRKYKDWEYKAATDWELSLWHSSALQYKRRKK
jgi:hypothetical protein